MVAITVGIFNGHMTSAPWTRPQQRDGGLIGPHCSHHDACGMEVCQDGYAWHPCRIAGCEVCGGPPVQTPEHWAGDVVALALMSAADRARALAHQQAYPLLRRPGDPKTIPDERAYGPSSAEYYRCEECGADVEFDYLDVKEVDGIARFGQACADHGCSWPDTLTIRTPSGGLHLYFTVAPGLLIGSTAGRSPRSPLGPGIDTRGPGRGGRGGYLVGPGSVVGDKQPYVIERELPIAACPAWFPGRSPC